MSELKYQAVVVANRLNEESRIGYGEYVSLMDGLEEIDTLAERDKILEDLWANFADVPMNPETECMDAEFLGFPVGTPREDIWHWFDERHSKGVAYLLYGVDARATSKQPAPEVSAITLRTETPLGAIIARSATDPNHPGIYIDLRRGVDDPDMPLALVEFAADEADMPAALITRVWGNATQEDYTERVVHQNIERYFTTEEVP